MRDDVEDTWPAGRQSAVVLTVDYSDVLGILARAPEMAGRDKSLSVWRYGSHRGVERLLARLDEAGLKASWCLPGRLAETHGSLVGEIAAAGHEIACAGHDYEDFSTLTPERQVQVLQRGRDALGAAVGVPPRGFRLPLGAWALGFEHELVKAGFTWSSSWRGDDLPYRHPEAPGLVELPLHYELDDDTYLAFNLSPPVPPGQSRIAGYLETLHNWQADLEGFHRFGLCAVMRLHPELIGTPGRAGLLRGLLATLSGRPACWVATGDEVARWWAAHGPETAADHPASAFLRYRRETP